MRRNYSDRGDEYGFDDAETRTLGTSSRGRAEYGGSRNDWGSARSDYGRNAYGGRASERDDRTARGPLDRATDEVMSWFGDDDAERRRDWDERESRGSRGRGAARSAETEGRRFLSRPGGVGGRTTETGRSYSADRPDRSYRGGPDDRLRAEDLMSDDVATVRPEDPIVRAARIMREENVGAIPVVDGYGRARGMITDRDITCRVVADGDDLRSARVGDAMTDEIFACRATASLAELMETMRDHKVRRLPIVDDRDRVVGIVSQADLARAAERERGTRGRFADTISEISEPSGRPYKG